MSVRLYLAGFFVATTSLFSFNAFAADNSTPIEIALFPPVQFPSPDFAVRGLRLSVVGQNREAHGLDLALIGNMTKQKFTGVAIAGLFNYNAVGADIIGLQLAGLANLNDVSSRLYGFQVGAYNRVGKVYGVQIGLVNSARELHGIQIGLINFNDAGPFKASPIINVGF
ncbi:hypothetical protein AZI86_12225 [Bdellovibrio bacteriovorus]|uniref:PhaC PHA synthase n=1 Tax=Bdellovibrio bacteriovorus TaxID=959 RepID=A0A150WMA4_BDEBC|nr:hypothetical protein [Bdellovibrio bacteriovorus]KYG64955.1 hypothetical protein AZI86_12225 [Bdellovibrio bacteriovorus]